MLAYLENVAPQSGASFLCRRRRDRGFGFAWHFHPEFELTLILHSRGRRFVGDSVEPYADGDLVLLGPHLPHTWASDPARSGLHEALFCQFRGDLAPATPEFRAVRRLLERASRGLRFPGRGLASRLKELERSSGAARYLGLLGFLDRLARERRAVPLASRAYSAAPREAGSERIERVCRALNERFTEGVTLPEAAALAHLSIPAFTRAFKRATGKTLVGYLTELRIGRACRELIENTRSVSDIAFDSGFQNLSHFNRRFLALKGASPREFRRQYLHV